MLSDIPSGKLEGICYMYQIGNLGKMKWRALYIERSMLRLGGGQRVSNISLEPRGLPHV